MSEILSEDIEWLWQRDDMLNAKTPKEGNQPSWILDLSGGYHKYKAIQSSHRFVNIINVKATIRKG